MKYRVVGKRNFPTPVGHVLAPGEEFDGDKEGLTADLVKRYLSGGQIVEAAEKPAVKNKPGRPKVKKSGD